MPEKRITLEMVGQKLASSDLFSKDNIKFLIWALMIIFGVSAFGVRTVDRANEVPAIKAQIEKNEACSKEKFDEIKETIAEQKTEMAVINTKLDFIGKTLDEKRYEAYMIKESGGKGLKK
jgi:hypothetical protein